MTSSPSYIVSREDWSLHRKGYQDQTRHQEKVRDAITQNLPDLVTDESIILSNGKQVIKIPIRSLDESRFRYNYNKSKHIGQGEGDSQVGDVLGVDSSAVSQGKGDGAGEQAGEDYYEAEITMEELQLLLFDQLELPNLQEKEKKQMTSSDIVFHDIRKKGISSNLDKKRTIMENLRRNAKSGTPGIHHIAPTDLRYKTWDNIQKPHSNAVIIAMMDTSGSLGMS